MVNHVTDFKYVSLRVFHYCQSNRNIREFRLSNLSESATGLTNVRYRRLQILDFKTQPSMRCRALAYARLDQVQPDVCPTTLQHAPTGRFHDDVKPHRIAVERNGSGHIPDVLDYH